MAALLALLLLLPPTGPAAASPGGDPPGTPEVPPGPPEPPQDLLDAAYQARCAAPPAPGPCRASFQRWFHSPGGGGGCRPFTYGGCGGNANNYARRQDCERSCQRHAPGTEPAVQPTIALALLLLPLLLLLGGVAAALARRRFSGCAPPGLGRGPPAPDKEALVGAVGPM